MSSSRQVFVTGGTGYIGSRLVTTLLARGHRVRALVRAGSEGKLPRGAEPVIGSALDAATFRDSVAPCDTFVQLVGTPHPGPAKAHEFETIDLPSALAAADAARHARVAHVVYVSVAHPAPVMRAYQAVRIRGEAAITAIGIAATFLRPWYVLGPGHQWPRLLVPLYAIAKRVPAWRDGATRCGLVTIAQMLDALVFAVEQPATGIRVLDVPAIRAGAASGHRTKC
ncbi:MAG: NAD(P)H-binding protein [Gemmatimonadetes bacterium]|nr:NAD(P)H-binding protein [Gemmatimonadota bacterium]